MKRTAGVLMLSTVLFALAGILGAQTTVTGAVTGEVTDTSGAVISDATVQVTNTGTNVSNQVVTNESGVYRVTGLLPGTYALTIEKKGLAKFIKPALQVDAGTSVRVDASLPVAGVNTAVTVTGQSPILQTDTAEVSQGLAAQEISALPTFGRNVTRLSLLAPGASMPSGQLDLAPENAGGDFDVYINGTVPGNNSRLLDGVDNTEIVQGLSSLVPSLDSVQDYKFTTNSYDAEYGQVGGGVLQVTTKSGTNQLHGSLFEYYRSADFSAADTFSQPNGPPPNVWNQFGGSLGGAIKKDKLFFFGDFQGMRNHLGTSSLYTAPIDAFKNGDFSSVALTHPIFDPATGNPDGSGRSQFSCNGVLNVICPNRFSPAAVKLLALLPEAQNQGATDNNYAISRPAIYNEDQGSARIDLFATSKTLVFGKFAYFRSHFYTNNVFGTVAAGPPLGGLQEGGDADTHTYNSMVDYQHTFSPTLLQDFRFSYSRLIIGILQLDAGQNTADTVGIPNINLGNFNTTGTPTLNIDGPVGTFSMGDWGYPFTEHETNFTAYDDWTKTWGRHSFKFGGTYTKFFGVRADANNRGTFEFSPNTTGSSAISNSGLGMASFLLGIPSNYNRDLQLRLTQEKQWRLGFYGQDHWQITPKLTIMLGLRWDYDTPMYAPNGSSLGNVDLNTGDVILSNLHDKYMGVTSSKREFSPRVGMSYRIQKDTVLRGGYGRSYFLNKYGSTFATGACCWPIQQSQTFAPANPYAALGFTIDQGPGIPPPIPPFPSSGVLPLPDGFGNVFFGVGEFPHSYTDGWNLTLEHAFGSSLNVSLGYVGNVGEKLWSNIDPNAPVPGPGPFNPRRPYFAKYGWTQGLLIRNDHIPGYQDLSSNYNSLQAKIEKRFGSGLFLLSNFVWEKSLDYGTDSAPGIGPENYFNIAGDYGNSSYVRPWSWITAINWDVPFGRGKAFGNHLNRAADIIAGGWIISGVVNVSAGTFFTPYLANTASLNSTVRLRPDRVGNPWSAPHNQTEWYNPAAFAVPALYTEGTAARQSLLGPGFASTDLSLAKSLTLTERVHLELRWDAFNAFNKQNLANPNNYVDTATAGQITSIEDSRRRMQIGAHITF
jgi:outer membrane receptor protein involved in Fe transport